MTKMFNMLRVSGLLGLVFTSAASSASANRLSISNKNIRASWPGLNFSDPDGIVETTCAVTIEGSFHASTITKTTGALIGYITRVPQIPSCTGGGATFLQESLPWHIRYDSFTGALPNIIGVRIQLLLVAVRVDVGFLCLFRSSATTPLVQVIELSSSILRAYSRASIPKIEGSVFCPPTVAPENAAFLTLLGTTQAISVSLI